MTKTTILAVWVILLGCLSGCGPSESEYESLVRESHELMNRLPGVKFDEREVEKMMEIFRALSKEEQKREIELARETVKGLRQIKDEVNEK